MRENLRVKYAPQSERGIDWRDNAACLTADPELFFPNGPAGLSLDQIERARRICRDCPVIMECLANALKLSNSNQFGIAGGLTEKERKEKRKDIEDGKLGRVALIEYIDSKL